MWKELRDFIARGNVFDLAVGIVIGAAFTAVVNSFVKDLLMPIIGFILGGADFTNYFIVLKGPAGATFATLAAAQDAGAVTINWGLFLNGLINFLIVALVLFFLIKGVNKLYKQPVPPPPDTKECPYCLSKVPTKATRCPQCTSELRA
jgi:large conductance mechanosensitive channel